MTTSDASSPSTPTPEDLRVRTTRAHFAFEAAMADRLHSPARKVFGWRNWWMSRRFEHLAAVAGAWTAICTLASLPEHEGVRDVLVLLLDGLPAYHRDGPAVLTGRGPVAFEPRVVPPLGRGGEPHYGDNALLALALAHHQELCHDDVSLPLAQRIFEFVVTGWSTGESYAAPGGIRSTCSASGASRGTATNGAVVALAVLLHRLTGNPTALSWALRIYHWTHETLLAPAGLYAERIDPDGSIIGGPWTDDQGAMLGASVLLADVTGDPSFLTHARDVAAAARERFDLDDLVSNGPARNAVFFRNLFLVPPPASTVDAALSSRALAGDYDDHLWNARDRRSGLIPGRGSPLSRMGALIQIDALLAGAPPHV